jgi:histidinol-phosphatase (PHP family)
MIQSNYHIHTDFCDGKQPAEAMTKAAVRAGLTSIGFSSHAPLKYPNDWTMAEEDLPRYLQTIESLKARFKKQIEVYTGLEIDYYMDTHDISERAQKTLPALDYWIGSIHCMGTLPNGEVAYFDDTPESMQAGLTALYDNHVPEMVGNYYQGIARMVTDLKPDIVAHFDLIKKNNAHQIFFEEQATWYRDCWHSALEAIARAGSILEINTGGVYRYGPSHLYPSVDILKEAHRLKIPITVSGDSHDLPMIDYGFKTFLPDILSQLQIREMMILHGGKWTAQPIENIETSI